MIVGWQVSDTLRAELALDALEMAIWSRGGRIGGRWFTIRTVECSILRSAMLSGSGRSAVGRKGDSYDNAAAESLNSLYKKELIDREGRGAESRMSRWLP
jgi:putative transposase